MAENIEKFLHETNRLLKGLSGKKIPAIEDCPELKEILVFFTGVDCHVMAMKVAYLRKRISELENLVELDRQQRIVKNL